jgi:hypothetical protein
MGWSCEWGPYTRYFSFSSGSWDVQVRTMTGLRLAVRRTGVWFPEGLIIFLFHETSRPALGPTQLPIQSAAGGCSPRIRRPGMNTTTHPNTVPGVRMNGVVPPPHIRLHGVHIDDFALTSISKSSDSQNGELSQEQKTRSLCSKVQKPCQSLQPLRCVFTYSLPVYGKVIHTKCLQFRCVWVGTENHNSSVMFFL